MKLNSNTHLDKVFKVGQVLFTCVISPELKPVFHEHQIEYVTPNKLLFKNESTTKVYLQLTRHHTTKAMAYAQAKKFAVLQALENVNARKRVIRYEKSQLAKKERMLKKVMAIKAKV